MAQVLVTDGQSRAALAVVRSLGLAGHGVRVCAPLVPSLAGSSRHVDEEVRMPDPLTDPVDFVEALARYAHDRDIDVLLPMSDESLSAVLPHRDLFGNIRIPFPEVEAYRKGSDKFALLDAAREVGLAVPLSWAVESPAADAADLSLLPYPVVVKPSRSVVEVDGRQVKLGVTYGSTPDQVRERLRALPPSAFPVLLQECIQGDGCGVFLLVWDGTVRAIFGHRRLREKPPSGGVSTFRESVQPDPDLVDQCERLLAALGWQGVAMVEFKRDQATGVPYVMEVNGRFWGSLQLAVDAGVDFPALLVRAALGEALPPPPTVRPDVRLRWLWGDVDHLLARLRNPGNGKGPSAGISPGRWNAVRQVVGSWRPGERWETLRLSDPRPFFRETVEWMRSL